MRLLLAALLLPATLTAQAPRAHVKIDSIAANPADVATIDGVMKAFYDVISGPAGTPRQWNRDRTLYIPNVQFVAVGERKDGTIIASPMGHQEYADRVDPGFVKRGFFEKEIHRVTHQYGNIAVVLSTYESRDAANGPVTDRGVNIVSLVNDGKRWWVAGATWQDETPKHPLPKDLLP